MEPDLAALHKDWQRKKAEYEALLEVWFPRPEPGEALPLVQPIPPAAMAELERRQHEAEQARLAYLGVFLSGPRE
ncbi:MAG: hypothetical protein ACYC3S_12535 [Chloroflexota bacterium]